MTERTSGIRFDGALAACAGVLGWLCLAGAGVAQVTSLPTAADIERGQSYVAPTIPMDYARRLSEQPDFQGNWRRNGADVFDPENYYVPPEADAAALAGYTPFGPWPGSYLTRIPYKPEYLKKYRQAVADSAAGKSADPFALCKPFGMPRFMGAAGQMDIMQGPELVVLHNSFGNESRRIFLDGRPHTPSTGTLGVAARTHSGNSIGRWEGQTLVVDTINMAADVYDGTMAPHSDQVRLTERFKLLSHDLLQVLLVVEDPVMLTGPWQVRQTYRRVPVRVLEIEAGGASGPNPEGMDFTFHNLLDVPCEETIDSSAGFQSVILPQELEKKTKPAAAKTSPPKATRAPASSKVRK